MTTCLTIPVAARPLGMTSYRVRTWADQEALKVETLGTSRVIRRGHDQQAPRTLQAQLAAI